MSEVHAASTSLLGGPLYGLSITSVALKRTRSSLTALAAGAEKKSRQSRGRPEKCEETNSR